MAGFERAETSLFANSLLSGWLVRPVGLHLQYAQDAEKCAVNAGLHKMTVGWLGLWLDVSGTHPRLLKFSCRTARTQCSDRSFSKFPMASLPLPNRAPGSRATPPAPLIGASSHGVQGYRLPLQALGNIRVSRASGRLNLVTILQGGRFLNPESYLAGLWLLT